MQTLHAGYSYGGAKNFALPQTPFLGVRGGQNLISWKWSLPSIYKPSLVRIDMCNFDLS